MATALGTTEVAQQLKVNEKKWSPTLMKAGWTALPNVLFERQKALGLDAIDINIILHIRFLLVDAGGRSRTRRRKPSPPLSGSSRAPATAHRAPEAAKLTRREQRREQPIAARPTSITSTG